TIGAGVPGVEHAPAALPGRRFRGAALTDRTPVGGNEVDRHAELLQEVGGDLPHGLERSLVLGHETGARLARLARLRPQLLGAAYVPLALQPIATILGVELRARSEEARDRLPQAGVVTDYGAHIVFLVQGHLHGAPHLDVVERRMQVVHAERADVAQGIGDV